MPAKWISHTVATPFGYAHEKSGELLASRRDLTPAAGASGYKRNSKAWMTAYTANRPKNTVPPAVTGTPASGQTLTATNGTWTGTPGPTFTRQWTRDGVNIEFETLATFMLTDEDKGKTIRCVVTGTNTLGATKATSNAVAIPA